MTDRDLTVSAGYRPVGGRGRGSRLPMIRLSGSWLSAAGFPVGARVRVEVEAGQGMSWVALSDPIPGGASILGNTERDSQIAQSGENQTKDEAGYNRAWPVATERGLGFLRAYYAQVPKGRFWFEYTVRLNNPGEFFLPPTRVEAMYAPEIFGQVPNGSLSVK